MTNNSRLLVQDEHSPTTALINPSDPYLRTGSCYIKQDEGKANRSQHWAEEFCLVLPSLEGFQDEQTPSVLSPASSCVSPSMATDSLPKTESYHCYYTGCRTKWKRQSDLRYILLGHGNARVKI
jgi:hypothetical protein